MGPERARLIVGVILAGGHSRRMGVDKSFQPLAGRVLVEHAIARLVPQVAALVVNANGSPGRYARFGVTVVPDTRKDAGPLAGFLAGMAWASANVPDASHIATVAVDTPFFPTDLVARLGAAGREGAMARTGGRVHPVFALLPLRLAADLAGFLAAGKSLRAADWLTRHDVVAVDFDVSAGGVDPFFNINTPDDLATAEAITAGCTGA